MRDLRTSLFEAIITAFSRARRTPSSSAPIWAIPLLLPKTTIIAPKKPIITALQRRIRTISPRKRAAPIVAKIGDEKESAVAWDIGISVTAQNPLVIPTRPSKLRTQNNGNLSVRMAPRPARLSQGTIHNNARIFLKKTITVGCNSSLAARIQIAIKEKNRAAHNAYTVARIIGDSRSI